MAPSHDSVLPGSERGWSSDDDECRRQSLDERERAIVGSLLGTAVGDAMGLPYEGLTPQRAARMLGPLDRHRFLFRRGMLSDDTEHACLVAQSIIAAGNETEFAQELARRLRVWLRLIPAGVGLATLRACLKLNLGYAPRRSGVFSAGNGSAMRAPILGASIDDMNQLRAYVAASTRITHTDPRAEIGAMAVALIARKSRLRQTTCPKQFIADLANSFSNGQPRELLTLLGKVAASVASGATTREFAASIGLGRGVTGYVNHTVPVVLHAYWSHPFDYRAAVQAVIECGGDADTTAAIVGGIVGAAVGKEGIPSEWLAGIWEWPRSLAWLESLGACLAHYQFTDLNLAMPEIDWWKIVPRNAFFATIVLSHGFRRLLPPY